jgi:hypothetical protein
MAFTGVKIVRAKMILVVRIIEHVSTFKYLGYEISYRDVAGRLNRLHLVCCTVMHT